ncbi:MAG: hypothetical protein Q8Q03_03310 [bacterium]|nr:hypothetical protein [bacterium]
MKKELEALGKLFEGFGKFLEELFYYFLSSFIDSKKELGWRGYLYLAPILLAIFILIYSILKVVL